MEQEEVYMVDVTLSNHAAVSWMTQILFEL